MLSFGPCLTYPDQNYPDHKSGLLRIRDYGSRITDPGLCIWGYGSGIMDLGLGSGITDQGLRI